jgi:hypothetical protein
LTSISWYPFGDRIDLAGYGEGQTRGLRSVDIPDWGSPGRLDGRAAQACTAAEIRQAVQVCRS